MIPLVASISVRSKRRRGFRLWIPLALIWLLLLPVVVLLLPVAWFACWASRVDPLRAGSAFWQILCSLNGANVEVQDRNLSFLIHVF